MTTTTKQTAPAIDWNNEALAGIRMSEGQWVIVRHLADRSAFAVIAVHGSRSRVIKTLPTLDRARAYATVVAR